TAEVQLSLSCVPVSILGGDPEFPPDQHAGAIPPGSSPIPAREHLGFYALHVVPVGERVSAGCREYRFVPRRFAASHPRVLAVSQARFATVVATAGLSLELGNLPHHRARRIGRLSVRRTTRRPATRCPVDSSGACRPLRPCRPRALLWRLDRDAGKRA